MKPYRFTLEALLTLREHQKSKALEQYGKAVAKRQEMEQLQKRETARYEALRDAVGGTRQGTFNASAQGMYLQAIQDANNQLGQLANHVEVTRREERKQLDEFLAAKKRLDLLANLKERRRQGYVAENMRKEEKLLEDLANARYYRDQK